MTALIVFAAGSAPHAVWAPLQCQTMPNIDASADHCATICVDLRLNYQFEEVNRCMFLSADSLAHPNIWLYVDFQA